MENATQNLPNFCPADAAMQAAERFFSEASAACERNADAALTEADRLFAAHAASATARLASAFGDQRVGPDSNGQRTYMQYASRVGLPDLSDLDALRVRGRDAQCTLDELDRVGRGWLLAFQGLCDNASTASEQELHASCAQLIDTFRHRLSEAYVQRQDM